MLFKHLKKIYNKVKATQKKFGKLCFSILKSKRSDKKNIRVFPVRHMFPALLVVAGMMTASVVSMVDRSYIKLQTPQTTIEAGKSFSVEVYAYAHKPVNAVDITIQYDAEAVEVTGIDKGQTVITLWTEEPLITQNEIILRGGTFKKGFLGEHIIATVNFKAKKTGLSSFSASDVVLLAGDGSGAPVDTARSATSKIDVFVYDENTAPDQIGVNVKLSVITDIDGDGKVTLRDVSVFMNAWNNKDVIFDFNGDGRMTFKDFSIILADMLLK
jgi:hypothetical protein